MPGGLLNIVAYGNQNVILNGNPSKTFFKTTYAKYTNFGLQKFRIDYKGQRTLHMTQPSVFKFKIPRHAELLMDSYLVINIPHIWSPILPPANCQTHWRPYEFKWIKNLGCQMIDKINFTIGGHLIQCITGQYMHNQVERDFSYKKPLYYEMTGNIAELNDPSNAFNRKNAYPNAYYMGENYPEGAEPSIRGRKLYIPLNIWFSLVSTMALPLTSLQYAELEIEVILRPVKDLFVIRDPTPANQYTNAINDTVTARGGVVGCETLSKPDRSPYISPSFNDPLQQLYRFLYSPPSIALLSEDYQNEKKTDWDTDIHLLCTYAFLSPEETRTFANKPQNYLIKEIHEYKYHNISNSAKVNIETSGLVASWTWFFQRTDIAKRNEWSNYSNWAYDTAPQPLIAMTNNNPVFESLTWDNGIDSWTDGNSIVIPCKPSTVPTTTLTPANPPYDHLENNPLCITAWHNPKNEKEIMTNWGLLLDGKYRENVLDSGVLNYVEKYSRSIGIGNNTLNYFYNFGLNTTGINQSIQPSGAINMSKFKNVQFEIVTIAPPIDPSAQVQTICDGSGNVIGVNKPVWNIYEYTYDLTVIEERYNIVSFQNGTAALKYAR